MTRWSPSSRPVDVDDLARRVRELYGSPDPRLRIWRRAARAFVRKHNWDGIGGEYVALVQNVSAAATFTDLDTREPELVG